MVQAALPQVPVQTTVAPMMQQQPQQPQQQQAPAVPTVPRPASPSTPMGFEEAGPVDIRNPASAFVSTVEGIGTGLFNMLVNKFGSAEKAEKESVKKREIVASAQAATNDPKKVSDAVMVAAELPPTDESKIDFAQSVLGIDTDNVGEIDDAIFRVLTSDPSLSGQKLQQAVLLGLNNYKQTAAARAAAASGGGSGFEPMPRYGEALPKMVQSIMSNDPGISVEEAMVEAQKVLDPLYNRTGGGAPKVELTAEQQTILTQAQEALAAGKDRKAVEAEAIKRGLPAGAL
jgi:hypothetical protein|tara:strand:- start:1447 stop:2310 length:864 start_codon:yes stop_codon:yes gene_type:complete